MCRITVSQKKHSLIKKAEGHQNRAFRIVSDDIGFRFPDARLSRDKPETRPFWGSTDDLLSSIYPHVNQEKFKKGVQKCRELS
jgi:hypothetical protein